MTRSVLPTALVACIMLSACASVPADSTETVLATTTLANATGQNAGSADIVQSGAGAVLRVRIIGQSAGVHGIHLHTTGKCDAPGFTSAGGHLNPSGHQHGNLNPAGPHVGDLPNIVAAPDGSGMVESPLTGTSAEILANMFDADGTAIVLHAGPDDYKTDPSGNSGGRIACGIFIRAAS